MLSRRGLLVLALVTAQVLLLWVTLQMPWLGVPVWHHFASLGITLIATAALWRPFSSSRRFLALGILAFSVLATVSGFWLLYWKEGIRADGLQDWGVWWHVLWSWFAAVFFLMHVWINRVAFLLFWRRSFHRAVGRTVHTGAYVLLVVAFLVTWADVGKAWFTNANYITLSLYTWLLFTLPPYAFWGYARSRVRTPHPPAWSLRLYEHWRARSVVDLALVPVAVLVVVSGVVLTFLDPTMDRYGWKYVSKYWHVWPGVAFAVLAFVHSAQAWGSVRAHWRGYLSADPLRGSRGSSRPPQTLSTHDRPPL